MSPAARSISSLRRRLTARPPESLTLALLLAGATVSLAVGVLHPMSPEAPVALGIAFLPVAIGLCAGVFVLGDRLPQWAFAAVAGLSAVLNAVLLSQSATLAGAMVTSMAFFWLTVYVAIFFPAIGTAFAGFTIAALGLAMAATGLPSILSPVLIMGSTILVAALVLVRASRTVRQLMQVDTLTGTLNRGAVLVAAEREIGVARRRREPFAVVAVDLDGFKLVNDRFGHAAGDRMLVDVSAAWRSTLRAQDVLGRMGGDEFVLLLPDTDEAGAADAVRRMRDAHDADWSAGIAVWEPGEPFDATLERADARLYAAKRPIRAA